jgi:hypothetical protein
MMRRTCASSLKLTSRLDLPVALDVHVSAPLTMISVTVSSRRNGSSGP